MEAIVTWAEKQAQVPIERRAIVIRRGKPVAEIWREANARCAALVVGACETSGHTLREVLLRARRSVLSVPLGLGARLLH